MEIKIIEEKENELVMELGNLTIAELLRNELWNDKATKLAAWKREHPTKNAILELHTRGKKARKVLLDTIKELQKQNQELKTEFKKMK